MAERAEAMQKAQEAARKGGAGKGTGGMRNATPDASGNKKKRPPRTGG